MLRQFFTDIPCQGYVERVFARTQTQNAQVRIVDNLVEGGEIHGCDLTNTVRWRLAPNRFGAPGRLGAKSNFVPFGKVMFFPANVPYQTRRFGHAEQNRMVICHFENDLNDLMSELSDLWNTDHLARCLDVKCGRIDVAMNRLSYELMHPGFAADVLLDGLLRSIAVDLLRYFRDDKINGHDVSPKRRGGLSDLQLKIITEFIMSAREGCPTTAQLASLCNMNPSSFRQRFKQTTGKSLHAYVEEVRLDRAKAFLTDTQLSMKEIAYELGFTHQATFSSSFRRAVGMTPSEYRIAQYN